jgi:hypothetical protein
VFSFSFHSKNFKLWSIILQNETKHHVKFLVKSYLFFILGFQLGFWISRRPGRPIRRDGKKKTKKSKSPHPPIKNLAFWMELNTPIKILVFCILSFQSS